MPPSCGEKRHHKSLYDHVLSYHPVYALHGLFSAYQLSYLVYAGTILAPHQHYAQGQHHIAFLKAMLCGQLVGKGLYGSVLPHSNRRQLRSQLGEEGLLLVVPLFLYRGIVNGLRRGKEEAALRPEVG